MDPKPLTHFQRFEFKYPLDTRLADKILISLLDYMRWDPYSHEGNDYVYTVSSLYYDSPGYYCYLDKLAGLRNRHKLRLRFYEDEVDEDTRVFLEIKRKRDMVTIKDRVPLSGAKTYPLIEQGKTEMLEDFTEKERDIIEEFIYHKTLNCMEPTIMVAYKRRALETDMGLKFRVTFDSDLRTSPATWLNNKAYQIASESNTTIMEVKFNEVMPAWFFDVVQKYQLTRDAFSKYATSLDASLQDLVTLE